MLQKPFNESLLWKGQIQKCHWPSKLNKSNLVLPTINSLTSDYVPRRPSIHEELLFRYSLYSQKYWLGVKERQRKYRIIHYQDK